MPGVSFKILIRISQWKKEIVVARNSRQSGSTNRGLCYGMRNQGVFRKLLSCLV